MKRNWIYFLGFLLLLLCESRSFSQEREFIFDHFNISNGLISDNVYKIFIDRTGYIWIITYNGLQKFNGYDFETYTSKPGKNRMLSSNFVVDIFEDRDDDVIIVLDDGIDIYHKQTDSFVNLFSHLPFSEAKRNEITRQASIVQDKSGYIWTTCHNRLVRVNPDKDNFFVFPDEFKGNFVLNPDSTLLWIISEQNLKKYDLCRNELKIWETDEIPAPSKINRLNTIFYDTEGICWVGTSEGLFIFDDENYRFLRPELKFAPYSSHRADNFHENITAIYEDYKRDLWVASGNKLFRIDRPSNNIQILRHEVDNSNSILDEPITGIYGNRSGILWVTYLNEGFTKINIRTKNFRSYTYRKGNHFGLGGKTVRSVFKDKRNYIWAGLYNNGLDRINPSSGRVRHFKNGKDDEYSICSDYISSVLVDDRQRLWVGSHDNGLCYADRIYGDEIKFQRPSFLNNNDEVYHIEQDRFGRIWFGTRSGLGVFNYQDGSFEWVLEEHNVQSFLFDENVIWIASWDYGVCRLNFSPAQFASRHPRFDTSRSINYQTNKIPLGKNANALPVSLQNGISIYKDQNSNIWIGTYNKGLARLEVKEDAFSYSFYDESSGAPGNAVYGVAGDKDGNIWISTDHGIGKFNPENEHFENFYRDDGLLSDYFMWKAYYQAPDGELLFGNVDGLILFHPDDIQADKFNPSLVISELRIENEPVRPGDTVNGEVVLQKHIIYQDTLFLNYRNNTLSFDFFAGGQMNTEKIKYEHMLTGYDADWISHEKGSRTAGYTDLPPKTYQFRVRSTQSEGYWSDHYAEKTVVIMPPWWKTKLAYALYIGIILGLLYLVYHSLIRLLKLKHELLYNEKLHQSKLMFFTYVSHEFKTPLSLIIAPLNELLSMSNLPPYVRKNLDLARQNSNNLLSLVNELMEFRRSDEGLSKLKTSQIELISSINDIARQFECIAGQKDIQYFLNIPEEKINIFVDVHKFRKIINNLIENALKYTPRGGLVTLSLIRKPQYYKFPQDYHTLHLNQGKKGTEYIGILVSDTGVGITAESLPKIFDRFYQIEAERASHHLGSGIGLALVKNLVLLHGGEIKVASERGKGTEILVMLPVGSKQDSKENFPDFSRISSSEKTPVPVTPEIAIQEEVHGQEKHGQEKHSQEKHSQEKHSQEKHGQEKHGQHGQEKHGQEKHGQEKHGQEKHSQDNHSQDNHSQEEDFHNFPRILIVEDHEQLRTYLKNNFTDQFSVIEASNGEEGLEKILKYNPDLIITDWIMPVMDGREFLRNIKSSDHTSSIPVILLTAMDELKDQQEGLDLGADYIITKPFNLSLLKKQVKRMVENNRTRIKNYGIENSKILIKVKNQQDEMFLERVEHLIYENVKDPGLNARFIARSLTMSRTALYVKIKKISGLTIGEYIQKIRLKHALKLMLYENLTVSEVHVMVGISSSSYFIRLFRKYYSTTPGEYIRNINQTTVL